MNLLEIYLEEIISVEPYENEWTKDFKDRSFVKVVGIFNCYGNKKEETHIFNNIEWENVKEKGYYIG